MLRHVVAKRARYLHMDSFERVHELFVLVVPLDATKKYLTYCNIPKGVPQLIDNRLRRLCERCDLGMIPAVQSMACSVSLQPLKPSPHGQR